MTRFDEQMHGFIGFGVGDHNAAWRQGRRRGTPCAFHLAVEVAPDQVAASATGHVACPALGGDLPVSDGELRLLEVVDGRQRRFVYWLRAADPEGRPLTFAGFKYVTDDPNYDVWADTTTLFVRIATGHFPLDADLPDDVLLGRAILHLRQRDAIRLLASMRGRPRELAHFGRAFSLAVIDAYRGPQTGDGMTSFVESDPFARREPGEWHALRRRPDLQRRILGVRTADGRNLTLHHLRAGDRKPTRGPVYIAHAAAARAHIFYSAPRRPTLVDALLEAGYDVYLGNWRGSVDVAPNDWTLDEVAAYDHPALVARVCAETGAPRIKAVVHCMGSASFCLAAAAGLLPEVDTIAASAVAWHFKVRPTARVKQIAMLPLAAASLPGLDPQWATRAPSMKAKAFARIALAIRRDCDSEVCRMAHYSYGTGPDVVWRHAMLDHDTHDYLADEFGYAPFSLFTQLAACCGAGHLVPAGDHPRIPPDITAHAPETDARFTLFTGTANRVLHPDGLRRSAAWLERVDPGRHRHLEIDGFGHFDLYVGRESAARVYPVVLDALQAS